MSGDLRQRIETVLGEHHGKRHAGSGKIFCQDAAPNGLTHAVFDTWKDQRAHVAESIAAAIQPDIDTTAEAMFRHRHQGETWDEISDGIRNQYREMARAAINAWTENIKKVENNG